jgi:pyrimidine-nucleoside phosphorylase
LTEIIRKKRNGDALSQQEIEVLVSGFVDGSIPDYQVAAWLMAVYFQGLDDEETAFLTDAMMRSGEILDLSSIPGVKVDKHSTGGVGDKTTLIVAPLVASAGLHVAKMSGRGLGHTGGTLDKLQSIPGFRVDLSPEELIASVRDHFLAVGAQNERLVPADKKLYALRDVTSTVEQISLIASSIMSKKLACGADAIVIDLKVGSGAFIHNREDALKLATIMQATAKRMGRRLTAVMSDMDQPLGHYIGNAMEVYEAVQTLQGKGPKDLTDLCLELGSHMLLLGEKVTDPAKGREILSEALQSGAALAKFREFVVAQGGDPGVVDQPSTLLGNPFSREYLAEEDGVIHALDAFQIGLAAMRLGAGRETKESIIDPLAGIRLWKKIGEKVKKGDLLATLYSQSESSFDVAFPILSSAWKIDPAPVQVNPLILQVIQG